MRKSIIIIILYTKYIEFGCGTRYLPFIQTSYIHFIISKYPLQLYIQNKLQFLVKLKTFKNSLTSTPSLLMYLYTEIFNFFYFIQLMTQQYILTKVPCKITNI